MRNSPAPSVRQRAGETFVRFPPQRQWGFVSVERFELSVDQAVPVSHLRHAYARLNDVKISVTFQDLERLLIQRTADTSVREIHLESPTHDQESGPAPLMCWGVYQPKDQRAQVFYLEGGFHSLPHGLRFEFYTGQVFGLGALNAETLAATILAEAKLPTQSTHPTVIHLDPLTELSIACCLDWGWKLPQRRINSCLELTDGELRLLAGSSLSEKERTGYAEWRTGVTPEQRAHLQHLKRYHEGESLINAGEHESALIFYQSHIEDPRGAQRYFELRHWLEGVSGGAALKSFVSESSLSEVTKCQALALISEQAGDLEEAAEHWRRFIDIVGRITAEGIDEDQASEALRYSSHAQDLLKGLAHLTRGHLLSDTQLDVAAADFESARDLLGVSPHILRACADVATQCGDRERAHERLREMADNLTASRRIPEAAATWVKAGDLWTQEVTDHDRAERAYLRAIELFPDSVDASHQLSELYVQRGDIESAKLLLERLLERLPYEERAKERLKELKEIKTELLARSETQVTESALTQARLESSAKIAFQLPPDVYSEASATSLSLQDSPLPYPLEEVAASLQASEERVGSRAVAESSINLAPPPSPLSAASIAGPRRPEAAPLFNEGGRHINVGKLSSAARTETSSTSSEQGPPRPPRGHTPSRLSSDQLDVINRALASTQERSQDEGSEEDESYATDVDLPAHEPISLSQDGESAQDVEGSGATEDAEPVSRETSRGGRSERKVDETDREGQERLNILKKLAHKTRASILSQTQACLEVALIYRDQLLDIAQAQEWLWEGLKRSPEGGTLHEICESLIELYTSQDDYEGLLGYHQFVTRQSWGDSLEAHLQSASLLKALSRPDEAIRSCDAGLNAFEELAHRARRARRQDRERIIILKSELLSQTGDPQRASETLLQGINEVGEAAQRRRKRLAAQALAESAPQQSAELYEELYQLDPSESRLDEWLRHVNLWGAPHARASAVRAYAQEARAEESRARIAPRCLAQLAGELEEATPLLALELYFESLADHPDIDVAERAVGLAQRHHQHQLLLHALNALIPECFPGEYRGVLKLKRSLSMVAIHDERAEGSLRDALRDLSEGVEDLETLRDVLEWGQEFCPPETLSHYLAELAQVGIEVGLEGEA